MGEKVTVHHFFHYSQGCFPLCGVAHTHPATQEVSSTAPPFSLGPHLTCPWWKLLTGIRSTKPCGEVIIWTAFLALSFPLLLPAQLSTSGSMQRDCPNHFSLCTLVKMRKTWPFFFMSIGVSLRLNRKEKVMACRLQNSSAKCQLMSNVQF